MRSRIILIVAMVMLTTTLAYSQVNVAGQDTSRRVITTAVPFMTIAPDARSAAMGDVGVATSADANSMYWNVAKLAFIKNDIGFSLSYSRWLAKIIDDMSIANLSGYFKINREQTIGIVHDLFRPWPNTIYRLGWQ